MTYIIIILFSIPILIYILDLKNTKRYPVSYGYFFGVFVFILLGSFYSLDGDNPYYGGNLDSIEYRVILLALVFSFYLYIVLAKNIRKKDLSNNTKVVYTNKYGTSIIATYRILSLLHFIYVLYYFYSSNYFGFFLSAFNSSSAASIIEARTGIATGGVGNHIFVFYNMSIFLGTLRLAIQDGSKMAKMELIYYGLCCVVFFHKMPIIYYMFSLWIFSMQKNRNYSKKNAIKIFIVLVTVIFLFYTFYFSGRDLSYYLIDMPYSILHRIVGVYSEAIALAIKMANESEIYMGKTFINPLGIFNFEPVYLPRVLHMEFAGFPGAMVVPAVGEIYSNFGMLGSINFIVMATLFVFIMDTYIIDYLPRGKLKDVIVVYFLYLSLQMSQASIFTSFADPKNIIFMVIFIVIYKCVSFTLRKKALYEKNPYANKNTFTEK